MGGRGGRGRWVAGVLSRVQYQSVLWCAAVSRLVFRVGRSHWRCGVVRCVMWCAVGCCAVLCATVLLLCATVLLMCSCCGVPVLCFAVIVVYYTVPYCAFYAVHRHVYTAYTVYTVYTVYTAYTVYMVLRRTSGHSPTTLPSFQTSKRRSLCFIHHITNLASCGCQMDSPWFSIPTRTSCIRADLRRSFLYIPT